MKTRLYIWRLHSVSGGAGLPSYGRTERMLLDVLCDGEPRSLRDLVEKTGLTGKSVGSALFRLWKAGRILRTESPTYEALKTFKGRAGVKNSTRAYHLYIIRAE